MTKRIRVREQRKVVSLLGGDDETDKATIAAVEEQDRAGVPVLLLWKPTLDIRMISSFSTYPKHGIPSTVSTHMSFDYTTGAYYPILYRDEFWLTGAEMIALGNYRDRRAFEPTFLEDLPLKLSYSSLSLWRWQLQAQMEMHWEAQEELGITQDGESDGVRKILQETDPKLLILTMVASLLHTIFNFLAFSNDVAFYRKRTDFTGISLRSMGLNCVFQTVILLYLFDNDTSWVVRASSSIGLVIEYWKMAKAVNFGLKREGFKLMFHENYSTSESETKTFDKIATDHVFMGVYPLILGYSCYMLNSSKFKSFYSWIISSLVGFIYAFGFVMMTPQLFINYKLKSVAHLPWRSMTFKAINTFIDDLFAFVVKMPTMHRLACLRDDFIFFIFLYQRYIYPTDKSRVNEFGQYFEEGSEEGSEEGVKNGNTKSDDRPTRLNLDPSCKLAQRIRSAGLDPNDPRVLRLLKGLVERDGDDKLDEVEEVQDAQGLDEGGEALGGDIAKSRESGTAESDIKKRSKRSKVCS
eukprot:CAMPEP_0172608176 /NCGR_PEP_ID=MMETSP1068-20121228/28275_1 /TAXON_ID=35684 /ORGANISM="Pseudopedinella elastica, Strain CCMP716" /LENGTH=523 /DNA_ID=CAMNT_0013411357 /DNA_START=14 /DNA_END=1585 /DNA_ORIENTATION=+